MWKSVFFHLTQNILLKIQAEGLQGDHDITNEDLVYEFGTYQHLPSSHILDIDYFDTVLKHLQMPAA